MPAKRWAKPGATNINTPAGAAAVASNDLLQFICDSIKDNNCLGLPDEEVSNMAKELMHCGTRAEVFDWTTTLMLTEAFAAEVVKRRTDFGPPFEGETVPERPVVPGTSAGTLDLTKAARSSNNGKAVARRNKRGVDISKLPTKSAESAALKPGLFECGCFGTVHNLRGNCANCGRIICEQEEDVACYFCGMEPTRCVNYEIAVQEGEVSEAALKQNVADYEAAIARRDKLLEYAQNRAKRTTVIDDQSATLFSPQSAWMSPEERRSAEKVAVDEERRRNIELMHRQRGAYQVHLNFVNDNMALGARKENAGEADGKTDAVGEGTPAGDARYAPDDWEGEAEEGLLHGGAAPLPSLLQKIWYSPDGAHVEEPKIGTSRGKKGNSNNAGGAEVALPALEGSSMPLSMRPAAAARRYEEASRRVQQDYFEDDVDVFVEESVEQAAMHLTFVPDCLANEGEESATAEPVVAVANPVKMQAPSAGLALRFPPTPSMLNMDDGICLSMHQPWASLLVAGIKTHEGRVWGTNYRGRLWIHAAAAQPLDVEEVEQHYSKFVPPGQVFPKHYPTKVLLGYVYLTECLDRESYEATFKSEERQEGSPFSFICVNAKMLTFPLPMTGDHKLFKLDHRVHVAAKKQLFEIE